MKLYVSGRLYFLQNKPDLRWAMQSYEDTALINFVQIYSHDRNKSQITILLATV